MTSFCYCRGSREEEECVTSILAEVKVESLPCTISSTSSLVLASVRGKCE